jgi:uncharacterized protein (DUF433 family)
MPTNRKLIGATAFTLALTGGGIAGALLGTPVLSSAQGSTAATTSAVADPGDHWGPGPDGGAGLAVAAEALGVTEAELVAALQDGQSIAEVADAEGVEVQTVIDALVADATTGLEAAIDGLPDRMTALVNQQGLPFGDGHGRGGPGGPGGPHGRGPGLDAAASAIGITEQELATALQDGSTIAEVADANGVEVQTVIDALVSAAGDHLDEEVTEGDLTEAEAATRKAALEVMIASMVNGEGPIGHGLPGRS